MNGIRLRRGVCASLESVMRLWVSACLLGLRYRSMFVVLPLCSSVCFFGLRFALSLIGLSS